MVVKKRGINYLREIQTTTAISARKQRSQEVVATALLTLMRTEISLAKLVRSVVRSRDEGSRSDPNGSLADFPLYYEDLPGANFRFKKRGKL